MYKYRGSEKMKKQNKFFGYLLIAIGVFYLLHHLDFAILQNYYSWPTLLAIIGVVFLIHSYSEKEYQHIFTGTLLVGLGIHFHGLERYDFWLDHWSVFTLIVGIALLMRFLKTKKELLLSCILIGISVIMIFSISLPDWFDWIYDVVYFLETFWPITLIVIGVYYLRFKK